MDFTVPAWLIPTIVSVLCTAMMVRPLGDDNRSFAGVARLLWLFPSVVSWLIYLLATKAQQ